MEELGTIFSDAVGRSLGIERRGAEVLAALWAKLYPDAALSLARTKGYGSMWRASNSYPLPSGVSLTLKELRGSFRSQAERKTIEQQNKSPVEDLSGLSVGDQTDFAHSDVLWHEVLHELSCGTRENLLAKLPDLLSDIVQVGGAAALLDISQAIQDVGRWWP